MRARLIEVKGNLSGAEEELIAEVVSRGGLIVFPTETVYGLGCAAQDREAIARLYRLKRRERKKPLALHLGRVEDLFKYALVGERERRWIERLLPGPYTLILRAARDAPPVAVRGGKVGARVPASAAFQRIAAAAGVLLAGTSANRSGEPPATSPEEAIEYLSDEVELIITTDEPPSGRSSAVIDLTEASPKALRGELPGFEKHP
ncbi:MAG: L-threonylcarbamoyladenylate synthase [Candidatus Bipolaricaulia bacterium]